MSTYAHHICLKCRAPGNNLAWPEFHLRGAGASETNADKLWLSVGFAQDMRPLLLHDPPSCLCAHLCARGVSKKVGRHPR